MLYFYLSFPITVLSLCDFFSRECCFFWSYHFNAHVWLLFVVELHIQSYLLVCDVPSNRMLVTVNLVMHIPQFKTFYISFLLLISFIYETL